MGTIEGSDGAKQIIIEDLVSANAIDMKDLKSGLSTMVYYLLYLKTTATQTNAGQ